jgi:hypothetical protein
MLMLLKRMQRAGSEYQDKISDQAKAEKRRGARRGQGVQDKTR